MEKSAARTKDLILLYRYKRTFLMIDEWGLYFLLIGLFYNGFPVWLISSIMFYGGVAVYTSYKNLDKIEQQIVPVDQEIHSLRDIGMATLEFARQVQEYFSQERQIPQILRQKPVENVVPSAVPFPATLVPVPVPVSVPAISATSATTNVIASLQE
jgi:hypothetical protein